MPSGNMNPPNRNTVRMITIITPVIKTKNRIKMRSFSDKDIFYDLNLSTRSCSCATHVKTGYCKHVEQLGMYPSTLWKIPSQPTFSQALSAFVKSVRLRKLDEAVFWTLWLNERPMDGGRFRLARRILIASAEDGHSISVMEKVSSNFPKLASMTATYMDLLAEVVRICQVPNWWHTDSGGHDYIRAGMISNRIAGLYGPITATLPQMLHMYEEGIEKQDSILGITALEMIMNTNSMPRHAVATHIGQLAIKYKNSQAGRLTAIHLAHKSSLSGDANFLCQATWLLCGGVTPIADTILPVTEGQVMDLVKAALPRMEKNFQVSGWHCDGIHCGGKDRRFAGIWHDMMAVCNAFNYYGNVEPTNRWLPSFYSQEGLLIQ